MCEPTTLAIIGIGFNTLGSMQQSQAQRAAGEANAQILEANAKVSEAAAGNALLRGRNSATRLLIDAGKVSSTQKSAYATAGVDTQSGSPVDVTSDTAGLAELDKLTLENNAALEAWGYKTQATDFRRKAILSRMGGNAAADATMLGGITNDLQLVYPLLKIGGPPALPRRPSYTDYNDQGI